jgi:hypothetical protein
MKTSISTRSLFVSLVSAVTIAIASAACVGTPIEDHACPPGGTTLTYENFGAGFFQEYCVRCHGGANGYSSRAFLSVDAIRAEKDRIFINAAGTNASMPPGPDGPTQTERDKLADWLACGAP